MRGAGEGGYKMCCRDRDAELLSKGEGIHK